MGENQFLTYQKFNDLTEAEEVAELLTSRNLDFQLENTSASFDPSFANNEVNHEYRIKLKKLDFEIADKIQLDEMGKQLDTVDSDYYLFQFNEKELMEVLVKSDEWGKFDYLLAQKILKERGKDISQELLETIRKKRINELKRPEESDKSWILIGYIFSFLGGLLGISIGWYLLSLKKTLPNGDSVYGYSEEDRKHGRRILMLGIASLAILTILYLINFE